MIDLPAADYYAELLDLLHSEELPLQAKFGRVKYFFDRFCRQLTADNRMQFPNLFSRLSYIESTHLSKNPQLGRDLNGLRVELNRITNGREEGRADRLEAAVGLLARAVEYVLGGEMPDELKALAVRTARCSAAPPIDLEKRESIARMRVRFVEQLDEDTIVVVPEEAPDGKPIRVRIRRDMHGDQPFAGTLEHIHADAQLNLIDLHPAGGEGLFVADIIVIEPDYLLDISHIAHCFQRYGHNPLNHFFVRLEPQSPSRERHFLLGHAANRFLDDIVNETPEAPATYVASMKKVFASSALSLVACDDLEVRNREGMTFFDDAKRQFVNLRNIIDNHFAQSGIDRRKALLEPSFVCEMLGIQGRLDLLQDDYSAFVELKSGKADENFYTKEVHPAEEHYVQMMLYYAVLHFNLGIEASQIKAFLLYSRYPTLLYMAAFWGLVKRAVNLRNQIVELEYLIQQKNDPDFSRQILASITPDTLNERRLTDRLWSAYIEPSIAAFAGALRRMSPLESDYYHALFTFITKEQYTAKAGDTEMEYNKGVTSLWNASIDEKEEAGEIIRDMTLVESTILPDRHLLRFSLAPQGDTVIPNYRVGDSIVLYQRETDGDRVTNHQVFKGAICAISAAELTIAMRDIQRNESVLPRDAHYAVERDYIDSSFSTMLGGLANFMTSTASRRALLLGQRVPLVEHDASALPADEDDIARVVRKAVEARDYFLLVGPPGTGKTSCALRRMVETFHADSSQQILLLAYTNKAVDEICQSIESIDSGLNYMRIGQEASCDERFRPRLIERQIAHCAKRDEVKARIEACRIFVGTITTFSRHTEIFRLKRFDVAIIDEATQILEPQLVGLLCATSRDGRDAINKFILIGDYKQLPAVVVQPDESAEVKLESLRAIGIRNFKESLFERLYRNERAQGRDYTIDMLSRQGRMHPDISAFPSHHFYHDRLGIVPLAHQQESWGDGKIADDDFAAMVCDKRLAFFPSTKRSGLGSSKLNEGEARLVGRILQTWLAKPGNAAVDPASVVGIITPYRSQIALIRKVLQELAIPNCANIVVDTVERFQGGQRDLMIYSCCMNMTYQLGFLSNTIEEEGAVIDRKLNVALTRARKQLFIVGNPDILCQDPIYARLIEHIRERGGYYRGE